MAKPRIIIADTNVDYIIPLQYKFVSEFFDKIDLEIITEADYFEELFSAPQKVDVLIISEDLYSTNIRRHNVANVFLMTEQYEDETTGALNVNRIFKYTSIKEIFNEIISKSADDLHIEAEGKKEPQIILVYSAKGGTGKTTVALGISACLTRNFKKVLYINASHLQSFQYMMQNDSPITASDVYTGLARGTDNTYENIKHVIRKEIFSYVPPFKASLMSLGLNYAVYEKIAITAKKSKEYDYIIVDADSEFDEEKAVLLNVADKAIIVTDQTKSAVHATNALVSNVNGMSKDKYIFICNKFNVDEDNALIRADISMKFSVSDYIQYFNNYEKMNYEEISKDSGMQKVAFLIM